jgi:hypothetical protein
MNRMHKKILTFWLLLLMFATLLQTCKMKDSFEELHGEMHNINESLDELQGVLDNELDQPKDWSKE